MHYVSMKYNKTHATVVRNHLETTKNNVDFDSFEVLGYGINDYELLITESLLIEKPSIFSLYISGRLYFKNTRNHVIIFKICLMQKHLFIMNNPSSTARNLMDLDHLHLRYTLE